MRISVFGMGYVGVVCAACFARRGHEVVGVDINADKVADIRQGRSPIVEPGLGELLAEVAGRRLHATTRVADAIASSDLSFIAVGTPSKANGDLDLSHVREVCQQIGEALRHKADGHIVVIRSTVLPGTLRQLVIPTLEGASGKRAGSGFRVAVNPEFLRECTAIHDFDHPPFTIIGAEDEDTAAIIAGLYEGISGEIVVRAPEVAEMIKYTCNAWHATKVAFANEIGSVAKIFGVDGREVMDTICKDKSLNVSPYYMRPGFAFGGSCLPKDVRALTYRAMQRDLQLPLLYSMLDSNQEHIRRGLDLIMQRPARRIGMLGLSFKSGTDDLRESPFVELGERLLGKGYDLRIYDRNVEQARVRGANKEYITTRIPHLSNLLVGSLDEIAAHADTLVISYPDPEFRSFLPRIPEEKTIIDLTGIAPGVSHPGYQGICW
ncbi:MAG TPA: UDP-glucose/GDP-mannose dehydrogenase family protein [Moraxellaceae bacterium]|nr:UDP-glucose/GDP-mannose dehydrogenase family protein [Moraxellaceae bacterium]